MPHANPFRPRPRMETVARNGRFEQIEIQPLRAKKATQGPLHAAPSHRPAAHPPVDDGFRPVATYGGGDANWNAIPPAATYSNQLPDLEAAHEPLRASRRAGAREGVGLLHESRAATRHEPRTRSQRSCWRSPGGLLGLSLLGAGIVAGTGYGIYVVVNHFHPPQSKEFVVSPPQSTANEDIGWRPQRSATGSLLETVGGVNNGYPSGPSEHYHVKYDDGIMQEIYNIIDGKKPYEPKEVVAAMGLVPQSLRSSIKTITISNEASPIAPKKGFDQVLAGTFAQTGSMYIYPAAGGKDAGHLGDLLVHESMHAYQAANAPVGSALWNDYDAAVQSDPKKPSQYGATSEIEDIAETAALLVAAKQSPEREKKLCDQIPARCAVLNRNFDLVS